MSFKDISPKTKHDNIRNVHRGKWKREPNAYTTKIVKPPSQTRLNNQLRHAVTHQDADGFEDYDEWGFKQ